MVRFGYITESVEDKNSIKNIVHMMTGCVKEIHRGGILLTSEAIRLANNPLLTTPQLQVLLYGIHNIFDINILKDFYVYPEALNDSI
jgi:uncharacterized protein YhhL (DUF1145 family)